MAYAEANKTNRELIDRILEKARERKGLSHREAAVLLDCGLEDKNQEIYELINSSAFGDITLYMAHPPYKKIFLLLFSSLDITASGLGHPESPRG